MMNELSNAQTNQLRDFIVSYYNLSEMKVLCADLGIDWENVSGETTRKMFAQNLVDYVARRGWLRELIQQIHMDRPTMVENSEFSEIFFPAYYEDDQEPQATSASEGNKIGCYGIVVIGIVLALLFTYQNYSKQRVPDKFVTEYINLLDTRNYQGAWDKLSGDYRINKHSTGYAPYAGYGSSFKNVEILKIEVLEETGTTASVSIFLAVTNQDGSIINQSTVYKLTRSTSNDPWIIADSSP